MFAALVVCRIHIPSDQDHRFRVETQRQFTLEMRCVCWGHLMLGGVWGGIGGAIGMTIGDLLDPVYVVYAPKTFILKFCIGLITGLVAHKIGKIDETNDTKKAAKWTVIASVCGLGV